jgi:cyclopropane-fatty-acyl-phospholipid synthase
MKLPKKIEEFLALVDVKVNGTRSWDIKVNNPKVFDRFLAEGTLGVGESFMDGWWDVKKLDEFICKVLKVKLDAKLVTPALLFHILKSKVTNLQTVSKSKKVAKEHYDIGNEFYEKMLDKRMQYTCGYWKNAKTLDEAQEHKLDLVCKKLQLKPEDKVLELGGGWGGFAKYAAEKYGCHVVSYNISEEQVKHSREICKGLPVTIVHDDYRHAKGKFDKIVSIGMCEHIGYKNYGKFMKLACSLLKTHGLFLVHTIAKDISVTTTDPWIAKYIFPNSMLPSFKQLAASFEGSFILEDWHNFGTDYDKTLMAWYANFVKHWDKFKEEYGERFYRMWTFYLLSCAGLFRARRGQLYQIVLSKDGLPGGYKSIR